MERTRDYIRFVVSRVTEESQESQESQDCVEIQNKKGSQQRQAIQNTQETQDFEGNQVRLRRREANHLRPVQGQWDGDVQCENGNQEIKEKYLVRTGQDTFTRKKKYPHGSQPSYVAQGIHGAFLKEEHKLASLLQDLISMFVEHPQMLVSGVYPIPRQFIKVDTQQNDSISLGVSDKSCENINSNYSGVNATALFENASHSQHLESSSNVSVNNRSGSHLRHRKGNFMINKNRGQTSNSLSCEQYAEQPSKRQYCEIGTEMVWFDRSRVTHQMQAAFFDVDKAAACLSKLENQFQSVSDQLSVSMRYFHTNVIQELHDRCSQAMAACQQREFVRRQHDVLLSCVENLSLKPLKENFASSAPMLLPNASRVNMDLKRKNKFGKFNTNSTVYRPEDSSFTHDTDCTDAENDSSISGNQYSVHEKTRNQVGNDTEYDLDIRLTDKINNAFGDSNFSQSQNAPIENNLPIERGDFIEDVDDECMLGMTQDVVDTLKAEHAELENHQHALLAEVTSLQQGVSEIRKLQHRFAQAIVSQDETIQHISSATITSLSNVRAGNKELTDTRKYNRDFRLIIILFFAVLTFALLFLHFVHS
eukprot:gene10803-2885_t